MDWFKIKDVTNLGPQGDMYLSNAAFTLKLKLCCKSGVSNFSAVFLSVNRRWPTPFFRAAYVLVSVRNRQCFSWTSLIAV